MGGMGGRRLRRHWMGRLGVRYVEKILVHSISCAGRAEFPEGYTGHDVHGEASR